MIYATRARTFFTYYKKKQVKFTYYDFFRVRLCQFDHNSKNWHPPFRQFFHIHAYPKTDPRYDKRESA